MAIPPPVRRAQRRRMSRHAGPRILALGASLTVLAGCNLGPSYTRPTLDVPSAFRATPESEAAAWPSPEWWRGFGSPDLDRLIESAVAYNNNLQAAIARVEQADAQVAIAGAPLLPSVDAVATGSYERAGQSGRSGLAGGQGYSDIRQYSAEFQASYEVDFWGRNRALAASARAAALASRFDQQTVALTVESSVATTYFTALAYMDRIAIARSNLASSTAILQAYQGQLAAGTASLLDVAQQQALVDGIRANIPNLQNQMQQQVIGLGILTGMPPERISIAAGTLTTLPTPTPVPGLPAALLARRPDVAYAEAELLSQNGNVRAARAAFFPDVSLTGAAGWQSLALGTLFGPGSSILSLAGNATQTIFDNGLLQGNFDLAKGRYHELVADYRQAVLQAFTDVDNAVTEVTYDTQQEALQRAAVASAQRASDIVRAQMASGTVDIITELNTQTTLYADVDVLAQVRLAHFLALVDLFQALGGGWTLAAPIGT